MKKSVYYAIFLLFLSSLLIANIAKSIIITGNVVTGEIVTGEIVTGESITGESVTGESVTGEIVTGKATVQQVAMNISVIGLAPIIITSPGNITYNFNIGDTYIIGLNVSANFTVNTWWFTLIDLKHNTIINNSEIFATGVDAVNTTFVAARWSNMIIVYANDSSGIVESSNVTFSIEVPNSAPILEGLPPELFVCENNQISSYFNVTDVDEDGNPGSLESRIDPLVVFFTTPTSYALPSGQNKTQFQIISASITKSQARGAGQGWVVYERNVSINDGEFSDSNKTNITAIEVNNAPSITSIADQSVWTIGDNQTFYHETQVSDTEDGNQNSGNLSFNITISNSTGSPVDLFNITPNGIINYTSNVSEIGVYNINISVTDRGIENTHQNITDFCGQNGSNITSSIRFSLTVTDENRAPEIINYYPSDLTLNVSSTDSLYFNITKYDADGTIPNAYWFVDDVFQELDSGSSVDEFTHNFGCGSSGSHEIYVRITDGSLNDSLQWNVSISLVECPTPGEEGAGGGGGGGRECTEQWICPDWKICQNAEEALRKGTLTGEDYRIIKDSCLYNNWDEKVCGFQTKSCFDAKECGTEYNKPKEMQACYYTEHPNCHDGIKNCHDGACEFLVDCGGPCGPCPTCSDNIQNQGEEGIDCGGPCRPCLPEEILAARPQIYTLILVIVIIGIIILLIIIIRILRSRRRAIRARKPEEKEEPYGPVKAPSESARW